MRNAFVLAVLLGGGCVTEMGDEDIGDPMEDPMGDPADTVDPTPAEDFETSARISLNGLVLNSSMLGTVSPESPSLLGTLAQGSLKSAGTRVPTLFATANGRDQFMYLVSCSLSSSASVSIAANGTTYKYFGALGMAPQWSYTALGTSSYKQVSACMLARTNYAGVSVQISMRSPKIPTSQTEKQNFTVVEGSFWGDVFTPGGVARACASPAKLSGANISTLPLRECTKSLDGVTTKCGFSYAGPCANVCVNDVTASMGYSKCEGDLDSIAVYVAK